MNISYRTNMYIYIYKRYNYNIHTKHVYIPVVPARGGAEVALHESKLLLQKGPVRRNSHFTFSSLLRTTGSYPPFLTYSHCWSHVPRFFVPPRSELAPSARSFRTKGSWLRRKDWLVDLVRKSPIRGTIPYFYWVTNMIIHESRGGMILSVRWCPPSLVK